MRLRRPRLRDVVALAVTAFIIILAAEVLHLVISPRTDDGKIEEAAVWTLFLTLLLVVWPMLGLVWSQWRRNPSAGASAAEVTEVADKLARQALDQWENEARDRGIIRPASIKVAWSLDEARSLPLAELLADAGRAEVGVSGSLGGDTSDLYGVLYRQLQHGQLVLTGKAGAGKTGAMMLLMLQALRERAAQASGESRSLMPVPVWLTLGGWAADKQSLLEYAEAGLRRNFPFLRDVDQRVIRELFAQRKVALFLDGLDEMSPAARRMALSRIDDQVHQLKIAITSRPGGYNEARTGGRLAYPVVINIHPIDADTATEYLRQGRDATRDRSRWEAFSRYLGTHRNGAVARALSSPLALSLLRAAYDGCDPMELAKLTEVRQVKRALMSQLLIVAYPQERAREHATRWLGWTAYHMGKGRDLRWWDVPDWIPEKTFGPWSKVVLTVVGGISLAVGIVIGGTHSLRFSIGGFLLSGIISAAVLGLCLGALLGYLVGGFFAGWAKSMAKRGPRLPSVPRVALREIPAVVASGICGAVVFAVGAAVVSNVGKNYPGWVARQPSLAAAILAGFVVGALVWVIFLGSKPASSLKAMVPVTAYRNDLVSSLMTATLLAAIVAIVRGVQYGMHQGLIPGMLRGVGEGISLIVIAWLFSGVAPAVRVSEIVLSASQRRRANLMRVYEDALARQLLYQVGAVYQFRHGELQDYLCEMHVEAGRGRLAGAGPERSPGRADSESVRHLLVRRAGSRGSWQTKAASGLSGSSV